MPSGFEGTTELAERDNIPPEFTDRFREDADIADFMHLFARHLAVFNNPASSPDELIASLEEAHREIKLLIGSAATPASKPRTDNTPDTVGARRWLGKQNPNVSEPDIIERPDLIEYDRSALTVMALFNLHHNRVDKFYHPNQALSMNMEGICKMIIFIKDAIQDFRESGEKITFQEILVLNDLMAGVLSFHDAGKSKRISLHIKKRLGEVTGDHDLLLTKFLAEASAEDLSELFPTFAHNMTLEQQESFIRIMRASFNIGQGAQLENSPNGWKDFHRLTPKEFRFKIAEFLLDFCGIGGANSQERTAVIQPVWESSQKFLAIINDPNTKETSARQLYENEVRDRYQKCGINIEGEEPLNSATFTLGRLIGFWGIHNIEDYTALYNSWNKISPEARSTIEGQLAQDYLLSEYGPAFFTNWFKARKCLDGFTYNDQLETHGPQALEYFAVVMKKLEEYLAEHPSEADLSENEFTLFCGELASQAHEPDKLLKLTPKIVATSPNMIDLHSAKVSFE